MGNIDRIETVPRPLVIQLKPPPLSEDLIVDIKLLAATMHRVRKDQVRRPIAYRFEVELYTDEATAVFNLEYSRLQLDALNKENENG